MKLAYKKLNTFGGEQTPSLALEFDDLFRSAHNAREQSGCAHGLRRGLIRDAKMPGIEITTQDVFGDDYAAIMNNVDDCGCLPQSKKQQGDCDPCTQDMTTISASELCLAMEAQGAFSNAAELLLNTKITDFVAACSSAYASVGDHPHKLSARKSVALSEQDQQPAAQAFYEYLQDYLDTYNVRVHEIPEAFNVAALQDVASVLSRTIREDVNARAQASLDAFSEAIERIFARSNLMTEYMKVIKDVTIYPLGVLWCDDASLKKDRRVSGGSMTVSWHVQSSAVRIRPEHFWATPDWQHEGKGTAAFRLRRLSSGALRRVRKLGKIPSKCEAAITKLLADMPEGHSMPQAQMFHETRARTNVSYDVLVGRGMFSKEALKEEGVKFEGEYEQAYDDAVPAEVWLCNDVIINARLIHPAMRDLGVYTTTFRSTANNCIWSAPLAEYIYPFARMYQGVVKAIDTHVGRSMGAFVSVDTGVLDDPEAQLQYNEKDGTYNLNLSEDTLIRFDSADHMSPNFKGVPISITQMPHNLTPLVPLIEVIFAQIAVVTGIPNIMVDGAPGSSALRTDGAYTAAYAAAAKPIKHFLRETSDRVLRSAIQYFYDVLAISGSIPEGVAEADPEILLADELAQDISEANDLLADVREFAAYRGLIPDDKLGALINAAAKERGIDVDLVPDVNPIAVQAGAAAQGRV